MSEYIKSKKNPIALLFFLVGILVIDVYLFSRSGYSTGRYFVVLLLFLSFVLNLEDTYYLLIFCFPFASILKLSQGSITIFPLLCLVIIFKLLFLNKIKLKRSCLLSFLFITIIQFPLVFLYGANIKGIISFLINIFFVLCSAVYFSQIKKDDNRIIKNSSLFFSVALVINVILCDTFPNIMYLIAMSKQLALEKEGRFGAMFVEPNEFSQAALMAIGLLLFIIPIYKNFIAKITLTLLVVFLVINGYRTYSKAYILVLLFVFFCLFIILGKNLYKNKGFGWFLLFLLPIAIILLVYSGSIYQNIVLPVFEARKNTNILSGRDTIWRDYLFAFKVRPDVVVWGCGAGNVTCVLKLAGISSGAVPHNLYLEFLAQLGVIGLLFLVYLFFQISQDLKEKLSSFFFLSVIAFFTVAATISANSNDCLYILMLFFSMPYSALSDSDF